MFRKCTEQDFESLKKMGFQIDISGVVPKIAAFPDRWIETGKVGLRGGDGTGCLCAGEFKSVITFSQNIQIVKTKFVAIDLFSSEEYGESDQCNEGDLIVSFDGV